MTKDSASGLGPQMMPRMTLSAGLRRIMRDSVRLYFAPLIGAIKGVKAELRLVDEEIAGRRSNRS